jgi:acetate kinase
VHLPSRLLQRGSRERSNDIENPRRTILAINAGSSSVKFQLFANSPTLERLAKGRIVNLDGAPSFVATEEETLTTHSESFLAPCTYEAAFLLVLDWIAKQCKDWQLEAVAHRIVHGGTLFKNSARVTPEVLVQLRSLIPLAPRHEPHNLAAIEIIGKLKPGVIQIACFDTAFHARHHRLFTEYASPQKIRDKGIQRYGFHGLSYEWIATVLQRDEPALARGRIIAAHLGNGASVCAMRDCISIETSMGMTALEGLPMGTRCGSLDPGAVIYMIRDLGLSPDDAEHCLYDESGLLGLSGQTQNIHCLQDSVDPKAQFALDYFALKVAQFIGMMAVAVEGVDTIVFTGGIGENSNFMRDKILKRLSFLKPFEVRVIPANEEKMMAMHARSLLQSLLAADKGVQGDEK